jgi:dTMP kinase
MGKLIVIEGMDGCGKATQTELLAKTLRERGMDVRKLEFPRYDSDSSALVKMYLSGRFGSDPAAVNCYAASAFYAVDRIASYLEDWHTDYEQDKILIADRYTTSNAIYQAAKLPESERGEYLRWLFEFEYDLLGLPSPDVVVYLDMPIEVSEKLLGERYSGDESKKDIHERDVDFQRSCRNAALTCAAARGWHIIDCTLDGKLCPREDIARDVLREVELMLS